MGDSFELVGRVSTEGGPFLVADLDVVRTWHGGDVPDGASASDYERACAALPETTGVGVLVPADMGSGVLWDVPSGSVAVWRRRDEILLCRTWTSEDGPSEEAEGETALSGKAGDIVSSSGWIVVVWAPEAGEELDLALPADGRQIGWALGDAGLILAAPPGRYTCTFGETSAPHAAYHCRLKRA